MKVINMVIPYVRCIEPNNNLIYLQIKGEMIHLCFILCIRWVTMQCDIEAFYERESHKVGLGMAEEE